MPILFFCILFLWEIVSFLYCNFWYFLLIFRNFYCKISNWKNRIYLWKNIFLLLFLLQLLIDLFHFWHFLLLKTQLFMANCDLFKHFFLFVYWTFVIYHWLHPCLFTGTLGISYGNLFTDYGTFHCLPFDIFICWHICSFILLYSRYSLLFFDNYWWCILIQWNWWDDCCPVFIVYFSFDVL